MSLVPAGVTGLSSEEWAAREPRIRCFEDACRHGGPRPVPEDSLPTGNCSAELTFDRALDDCERGEIGRGMLWLARGLQLAAAARDDRLERTIRANLAGWRGQIHPLKHLLPNGGEVRVAELSRDGRMVLTGDE